MYRVHVRWDYPIAIFMKPTNVHCLAIFICLHCPYFVVYISKCFIEYANLTNLKYAYKPDLWWFINLNIFVRFNNLITSQE